MAPHGVTLDYSHLTSAHRRHVDIDNSVLKHTKTVVLYLYSFKKKIGQLIGLYIILIFMFESGNRSTDRIFKPVIIMLIQTTILS